MYKRVHHSSIQRISDGAFIPVDERNADYRRYLEWLEEGNTALEPDAPPQPTRDEIDAAAARADQEVMAIAAMTPAQAADWIEVNVTSIATAKMALRRMAKALCILARRV